MTDYFNSTQRFIASVAGALFFAGLMISAAVPVIPVA